MTTSLAHSGMAPNDAVAHRPWPVIVGGALARAPRARGTFVPSEDFRSLDDFGTTVTFSRNETIFNEGDSAKYAYKLVSGAVRLCKLMADGRRQITEFYLEGDMFGFLDLDSYDFSAEAITNVVVMRYARNHLKHVEERDGDLQRELANMLHQRLSRTNALLVMLGRQTVKERIASFLIQMAERLEGEALEAACIDLPMGRQDIADYLGLTIETVCRALSELKRAGVIGVPTTHQIVVNDIETLRAIIDGDN
ncbi:helix-turn-helix domain-containing protein [Parvibaculum sp.]|uniref:helix-turn-helix domain-containing protein n=1 Tax=Parvibaculum sp. TaxID=2024848 RepID=UPI00320EEB9E